MSPRLSYLICATPRCGSNLLCEALENTGLAGVPREYFWDEAHWTRKWGTARYSDYLHEVIKRSTTKNRVFGTKVMWGYFDAFVSRVRETPEYGRRNRSAHDLLECLFPGLRYIWITRRDKVRQAVSFWKSLQTLVWFSKAGIDPPPPLKEPVYSFEAIDHFVQEIVMHEAAWQAYYDRHTIVPFAVIYEDLASAYEATALKVLDWLGVSCPPDLVFGPRLLEKQADDVSEIWVDRYREEKRKRGRPGAPYSPFPETAWSRMQD